MKGVKAKVLRQGLEDRVMDDYKEQKWGHGSYKREDQQSPGNRDE